MPTLTRYAAYSRREVRTIFAPQRLLTPEEAGEWEQSGIVPLPDRPGDFVFFVNLDVTKPGIAKGVTADGVLIWYAQDKMGPTHPTVQRFIRHDEMRNAILLLLRPSAPHPYTYLGCLKYLDHDHGAVLPVGFTWHILDWDRSAAQNALKGVRLIPAVRSAPSGRRTTGQDGRDVAPQAGAGQAREAAMRQSVLERRIQSVGKTNFVLLCEALLHGRDDTALMQLLPATNTEGSKRSIISTARGLVADGHTAEVLAIVVGSNLDVAILAEARRLLDRLT